MLEVLPDGGVFVVLLPCCVVVVVVLVDVAVLLGCVGVAVEDGVEGAAGTMDGVTGSPGFGIQFGKEGGRETNPSLAVRTSVAIHPVH